MPRNEDRTRTSDDPVKDALTHSNKQSIHDLIDSAIEEAKEYDLRNKYIRVDARPQELIAQNTVQMHARYLQLLSLIAPIYDYFKESDDDRAKRLVRIEKKLDRLISTLAEANDATQDALEAIRDRLDMD